MHTAIVTATTQGNVVEFRMPLGTSARLGRGRHVDMRVRDRTVSREHCLLALDGQRLHVIDLASSHGLLHRGNTVRELFLEVGDRFRVGETEVQFTQLLVVGAPLTAAPAGAAQHGTAPAGATPAATAVGAGGLDSDTDGDLDFDGDLDGDLDGPRDGGFADGRSPAGVAMPIDEVAAAAAELRGEFAGAAAGRGGDAVRMEPLRSGPQRRAAPPAKAFAARLAADSIVFSITAAIVVVALVLLRKTAGFDIYRVFGVDG